MIGTSPQKAKKFFLVQMLCFCLIPRFCIADSTKIQPRDNISIITVTKTEPKTILNEAYDQLPNCPEILNCPMAPIKIGAPIPDTASCPKDCRVDRTITTGLDFGDYTQVLSSTAPTCPKGYVAVTAFNLGRDIKEEKNPPVERVPDAATYNAYVSKGGICALIHAGTEDECAPWLSNIEINFQYDAQLVIKGYYGKYTSYARDTPVGMCYPNSSCGGTLGSCNFATGQLSFKCHGDYSWYNCSRPPGLYLNQNLIPISIFCTRIFMQHQPLQ